MSNVKMNTYIATLPDQPEETLFLIRSRSSIEDRDVLYGVLRQDEIQCRKDEGKPRAFNNRATGNRRIGRISRCDTFEQAEECRKNFSDCPLEFRKNDWWKREHDFRVIKITKKRPR